MNRLVSLTFDDALPEHLDVVVPLLNRYGFHGTFYVHLSSCELTRRADEWAAIAVAGHELGNHTVFHPADARKKWVTKANAIDDYTPERMQCELELANRWLQHLDRQHERSFAYPCSNPIIGRPGIFRRMIRNTRLERTRVAGWLDQFPGPGETRTSYQRVAAKLFTACRGGGLNLHDHIPASKEFDRYLLPSANVDNCSADEVTQFVERGLQSDTWPILQFHGIGGDHGQNCELTVFEQVVSWLAAQDVTVESVSAVAEQLWKKT